MKRFNQCVEVADIIKFSDQRIKDVEQFEGYKDKLFIQTQGARGLSYRLNSGWKHLSTEGGSGKLFLRRCPRNDAR